MSEVRDSPDGCFSTAPGPSIVAGIRVTGRPRMIVQVSNDLTTASLVRPYDEDGSLVDDQGRPVRGERWLSSPLPETLDEIYDGVVETTWTIVWRDDQGAITSIDTAILGDLMDFFDPFERASMPLRTRRDAVAVAARAHSDLAALGYPRNQETTP